MATAPPPSKTWPFYPEDLDYMTIIGFYHHEYRSSAIRNSAIMYFCYLPVLFVAMCVWREPKIKEHYKTTILFSAFVQFFLTLPQTIFHTWFAIAVSEDVPTTIFWCSMVKLITAAINFMSYNAIVAVGFSRLISLVFGLRIGLGFVTGSFTFCSALLAAIVMRMVFVNALYPHEVCSPIIFYLEDLPAQIYNVYTFAIPLIAVVINLFTVGFLMYHKRSRHSISNSKKVDELVVAFSLLLQAAIPAVTITAKAFFAANLMWLYAVPDWVIQVADWAGFFTTGLNVLASIVFIKSFQDQFKGIFWLPIKRSMIPEVTTITSVVHVKNG